MTTLGITQILEIFSTALHHVARPFRTLPEPETAHLSDPLDHPDLKRMTPRELADIPFPRPKPRAGRLKT
jgi:hypothetical protein